MDIGKLNKRIAIYRFTQVPDSYGGFNNTNTLFTKIWCNVVQEKGNIDSVNAQREYGLMVGFIIRKRTADIIQDEDVLEYNGDRYRINSRKEIKLDYFTELKCSKVGS